MTMGFRIERSEAGIRGEEISEVTFKAIRETTHAIVAAPRAVRDRHGHWGVVPGFTSSWYDADTARAKAWALTSAAEEAEKRNG